MYRKKVLYKVNVNVAVQKENGLYVPVIRDADKKGLSSIGEEVKHLAQKATENNLKPEEYEASSAEKKVIPGSGSNEFNFASFMSVTLSCDHRVIDGAIGAEWLKSFKGYIENPEPMLL